MLSIGIQQLVAQIVRHELDGAGRKDEALYINFDLRMSYFREGNSAQYNDRCGLHLLYHVNPGMTYISVFSAVTDSPFAKISEVKSWKHVTTHDSCWNDGGIFSGPYFNMANKINAALKADGLEEVAPIMMSEFNSFPTFDRKLFRWVPVEVSKDPEDDRNYRRLIKVLSKNNYKVDIIE